MASSLLDAALVGNPEVWAIAIREIRGFCQTGRAGVISHELLSESAESLIDKGSQTGSGDSVIFKPSVIHNNTELLSARDLFPPISEF